MRNWFLQLVLILGTFLSSNIFAESYGGTIGTGYGSPSFESQIVGGIPQGTYSGQVSTSQYSTPHVSAAAQTLGGGADAMMLMALMNSQSSECRNDRDHHDEGHDYEDSKKRKMGKKGGCKKDCKIDHNKGKRRAKGNCGQDKLLQALIFKKTLDEMKEKDCRAQGGRLVPTKSIPPTPGMPAPAANQNSMSSIMPLLMQAGGGGGQETQMLMMLSMMQAEMTCLVQPMVIAIPKSAGMGMAPGTRSITSITGSGSTLPLELQRELVNLEKDLSR